MEQNPHWEGKQYAQPYARLHDEQALDDLQFDEIQIVTGIRRCGKSTLLKQLIQHLCENQISRSILYINFDDPNYIEACNDPSSLYEIVTTAEKVTQQPVAYLFLDEVQNVIAWEKYIKSAYDSQRFQKIVITGSNADLLNSDYASLLSGRYIETRIYPLCFRELLNQNGITNMLQLIKQKAKVLALCDDMLKFGGFPRIQLLDDSNKRRKLLQSYYETIVLKDCIGNHNIRDTRTLQTLAHYLISNNSTTYSYNSLSKAIESNENTVQQFVQIFKNAYFLDEVYQFSFSLKKQARAKKKTYCIDNGLITATSFKFMDNTAKLFENLVYTELSKMFSGAVYFHNDKHECDFIVHHDDFQCAIQVCYRLTAENQARELNGLQSAMSLLSIAKGIVITYDQEETIDDNIQALPFWKLFSTPIAQA